jgi:geranylgeranyl reductase family protein
MYNTIIIGAGPVGSHLAHKLGQLGHKVAVLEKKADIGHDICCTGIVGKACYDILDIDNNLILKHANSAKLFFPSGKSIRFWRNDDVAYIINRPALNTELAERARASGAHYHYSTHASNIEILPHCLRVTTNGNGNYIEGQTAVIATGHGSDLPSNLNLGKISNSVFGAQAEVNINGTSEIEIHLDRNFASGGFAWLVPTSNGKGLAGLMTYHKPEEYLDNFLSNLKLQRKIYSNDVIRNYSVIPLRPLSKTYTDRILVVGEAAGQIKPTTGGGIYYGVLCAEIASQVIHQAIMSSDFSAAKLSSYYSQWRKRLYRELFIGYWAQLIWKKLRNEHIEYLYGIATKRNIPEIINSSQYFSFDWHSRTILNLLRFVIPFVKFRKQL